MKVIETYKLFYEITEELISLLKGLSHEQWMAPTCYPSWKVKDIAAHLLQTGISRLSAQRDRYTVFEQTGATPDFENLSSMIDRFNTSWTDIFASVSPGVLLELITVTERDLADFILNQDLHTQALYPVTWAGETVSENWFDLGREYTERWHHQQQIREAVGKGTITAPKYLSPVIRLFMFSLPYWYRSVSAEEGETLNIEISGESGGNWFLTRHSSQWVLNEGPSDSNKKVSMSDDTAWRFFTRSNPLETFKDKIKTSENSTLLNHFMTVKAIMIND